MKNNIALLVLLSIGLITSLNIGCRRDLGNYDYTVINETIVTGLDPVYAVDRGGSPKIAPKISYTLDQTGDTSNYTYQWLLIKREGYNAGAQQVLASGPVFDARVDLMTGNYYMLFRITDKRTGVWTEYPFNLFVKVKTYEGWMMLSEIKGGKSRLDMFNYDVVNKRYDPLIDVLSLMKSGFKLTGKPNFICYNNMNLGPTTNGTNDKIMISTTKEATFLGADTLNYLPLNDFGNYMVGPDKATGAGAKLEGTSLFAYLTVNDNIYYAQYKSKFERVNKTLSDGVFFKAGSSVSFIDRQAIVFDNQNSRFLWCPWESEGFYTFDNPQLNAMNKTLLFMVRTEYNSGETFAILKDKTSGKTYLTRLTTSRLNYLDEITGTDIEKAENFGVNSDFGYVFYNVGGKVYEYDFALRKSIEMADYGDRKISLLKFQDVQRGTATNNVRYTRMKNQLIVCSYEESNLDHSGKMDLYEIPPANGKIKKIETCEGLGKVVSVTYRSR